MAETTFAMSYDGPALETGIMPVRDLAPALFALGELFTQASVTLYPDRDPVALNVKATGDGSFLVHLLLESKKAWDDVLDVFGSDTANALGNLAGAVVGARGLFWFIKTMHNRVIVSTEASPEPGHTVVNLDDHTTVDASSPVVVLYERLEIRRDAKAVVTPLASEGINTLKFRPPGPDEGAEVSEEDVPAYEVPVPEEDVLLDLEQDMMLEITSVTFTEGNRWGFFDGDRRFTAPISDQAFVSRVNAGEPFSKGDMLRCRVRIVQSRRESRLHIDREVVRVLDHIRATDAQLSLEDDDALTA
jgi:hypothetical protein